jgi:hypothetical protein
VCSQGRGPCTTGWLGPFCCGSGRSRCQHRTLWTGTCPKEGEGEEEEEERVNRGEGEEEERARKRRGWIEEKDRGTRKGGE